MAANSKNRKKSNRRYRQGRIYLCGQCGNYSWLVGGHFTKSDRQITEDGKRPSFAKPTGHLPVTGRTCPRCRAAK